MPSEDACVQETRNRLHAKSQKCDQCASVCRRSVTQDGIIKSGGQRQGQKHVGKPEGRICGRAPDLHWEERKERLAQRTGHTIAHKKLQTETAERK